MDPRPQTDSPRMNAPGRFRRLPARLALGWMVLTPAVWIWLQASVRGGRCGGCPLCGGTRALRALMAGEIACAVRLHPAAVPLGLLWAAALLLPAAAAALGRLRR
jgi:hypothetical protein